MPAIGHMPYGSTEATDHPASDLGNVSSGRTGMFYHDQGNQQAWVAVGLELQSCQAHGTPSGIAWRLSPKPTSATRQWILLAHQPIPS